jgi:hypothetical protein
MRTPKNLKEVEWAFCKVCGKKYLRSKKPASSRRVVTVRGCNTKTCSHECSKENDVMMREANTKKNYYLKSMKRKKNGTKK